MIERPESGWKVRGIMTHPGAVLREDFMVPLDLGVNDLAERLHVSQEMLDQVVQERAPVTPELALRLARCFQGSAQLWMNLQSQHDLSKAEMETGMKVDDEVQPLALEAA